MKVAVTGATGFIGGALVERLADRADTRVRALHRGERPPSGAGTVEWYRVAGLGAGDALGIALDGTDVLVHLAGSASDEGNAAGEGADGLSSNAAITRALCAAAREAGLRRVVFVSSAKVHGERTDGVPFTETSPFAPEDAYARSKVEAEREVVALDGGGTEHVIVRPPLVYGAASRGNFRLLEKLVRLRAPKPLGSIRNARSMVHVDNLVDLLVACLDHPDAANEAFLVSDGEDVSTPELIRAVGTACGLNPWLVPTPPSVLRGLGRVTGRGAMVSRLVDSLQVDIGKARGRLGWAPPLAFDEAVRRSVRS